MIGGGITGTGVALDAASRGLSVALVDRHDFAMKGGSMNRNSWKSEAEAGGPSALARLDAEQLVEQGGRIPGPRRMK